jgi:hypothetical protein
VKTGYIKVVLRTGARKAPRERIGLIEYPTRPASTCHSIGVIAQEPAAPAITVDRLTGLQPFVFVVERAAFRRRR